MSLRACTHTHFSIISYIQVTVFRSSRVNDWNVLGELCTWSIYCRKIREEGQLCLNNEGCRFGVQVVIKGKEKTPQRSDPGTYYMHALIA